MSSEKVKECSICGLRVILIWNHPQWFSHQFIFFTNTLIF